MTPMRGKNKSARPRKLVSKAVQQPGNMREIQSVFDKLGIGSESSRESLRSIYFREPTDMPRYRVVLTGTTSY